MTTRTVIDVPAAAKLIGRTEGATRQMIARKQLPHRKAGKRIVRIIMERYETDLIKRSRKEKQRLSGNQLRGKQKP